MILIRSHRERRLRRIRCAAHTGIVIAVLMYALGRYEQLTALKAGAALLLTICFVIHFALLFSWEQQSQSRKIVDELKRLDDGYTLLRGWSPDDGQTTIEYVLIGPCGIVVLEQKPELRAVRCNRDEWSVRLKDGTWRTIKTFSRTLKRNMRLVEKHAKVPVTGAFVFGAEVEVETVLPTVHVFKRGQLAAAIGNLPTVKADVRELLGSVV